MEKLPRSKDSERQRDDEKIRRENQVFARRTGRNTSNLSGSGVGIMPEFFETGLGRDYYQRTLPELIRAINRLAFAIEMQEERIAKSKKREVLK